MITMSIYSKTRTFLLEPQEFKLTRRYEEDNHVFVAGDIKIDAVDAQDIYDAVTSGDEVSIVVHDVPAVGSPVCKFRGMFQSEGSAYDPETENYSLQALHISKKVFEAAKNELEISPCGINTAGVYLKAAIPAFDFVQNNELHTLRGIYNPTPFYYPCSITLNKNQISNANTKGKENDFYYDFLQMKMDYSLRDYWLDYAKHYRVVLFVQNDLDANGIPVLNVVSRASLATILHIGYDDLIAGYSEDVKSPQYKTVIFPYKYMLGTSTHYVIGVYSASGLLPYDFPYSLPPEIDNALDLRVPSGIYDMTGTEFPFSSIPTFRAQIIAGVFEYIGERPDQYAARVFDPLVLPYKEITVLYSQFLPVNPCEKISVKGKNVLIAEIEDDFMNETTQVIGSVYE